VHMSVTCGVGTVLYACMWPAMYCTVCLSMACIYGVGTVLRGRVLYCMCIFIRQQEVFSKSAPALAYLIFRPGSPTAYLPPFQLFPSLSSCVGQVFFSRRFKKGEHAFYLSLWESEPQRIATVYGKIGIMSSSQNVAKKIIAH
jgi:hypothetical protein